MHASPTFTLPALDRRHWHLIACVLCCVVLLCWSSPAMAQNAVLDSVFQVFENITKDMTTQINKALSSAQVEKIVNVLFTAMALSFFVWKFAGFALRGFDLLEIMEVILTIFFVYTLLVSYKAIFPAMYEAARYISDVLGNGIINGGKGTLASQIFTKLFDMTFTMGCDGVFDCLGKGFLAIPATLIGWIICIILGLMATLVEIWIQWGFMIGYAIGWVTIPFILYERLAFLFDGWLKFYFGMMIYTIVAKVNLALVLLGLQIMEGNGGDSQIEVSGFFDLIGLLVFLVVGICTLFKTSQFASAIVMGAGGGGISGMAQTAARMTASAISGGAGSIGGAIAGGK